MERLDILIYAHDGRGLGHASRSIAIGMALRRLFGNLRVLFVSGCAVSQELIGRAPLDWLKLPSYCSTVVEGKIQGLAGPSGFADEELGLLRKRELENLIHLYRPRLVLVDHTPQGKHKELVAALEASCRYNTMWVLGVRGVMGKVGQAGTTLGRGLFKKYFTALLWYGDPSVLGNEHCSHLQELYGIQPTVCGYVARLAEHSKLPGRGDGDKRQLAGTISIPWLGEKSMQVLHELRTALGSLESSQGSWKLFVGKSSVAETGALETLFASIDNCDIENFGPQYIDSLYHSKTAVIYGGYNSIVDMLCMQLPTLVIAREMQDEEQQRHVNRLINATGGGWQYLSESDASATQLESRLRENLSVGITTRADIKLDGAVQAATELQRLLSRLSGLAAK